VNKELNQGIKLSICIPTYNRAHHLQNCLQSIKVATQDYSHGVEVCIADNCSSDDTKGVVERLDLAIPVKYQRNEANIGMARNFLNVVAMAQGEYVWLVGDDDLLLPNSISRLFEFFADCPDVDFFYVNAFQLDTEFVLSHSQPFDTANLPSDLVPFSARSVSGKMPFLDLVDPDVSFDFLGGIFLSVFRRQGWIDNTSCLDPAALADDRNFSHFDNTFPHVKIFAYAFSSSQAYFNAAPVIVCLTGAREWAPLHEMILSVRLIEALETFRKVGLSYARYYRCRNFTLRRFWPSVAWMLLHPRISGLQYLSIRKSFLANMLYPNFYLSPVYFIFRKLGSKLRSMS